MCCAPDSTARKSPLCASCACFSSVIRPGCVLWNDAGRCPAMIAAAVGSNARPLTLQQPGQLATSATLFKAGRCPALMAAAVGSNACPATLCMAPSNQVFACALPLIRRLRCSAGQQGSATATQDAAGVGRDGLPDIVMKWPLGVTGASCGSAPML